MRHALFISFSLVFILVFIGVGVASFWILQEVRAPSPLKKEKLIEIQAGASVKRIAHLLEQENAISSALAFEIYTRVFEREEPLQAGEYKIQPHMSIKDIVDTLQSGQIYLHKLTIPEGYTNHQIRRLLEKESLLKGEIESMPPEGYLMPETYSFRKGLERQTLVNRIHEAKKDFLSDVWDQRQDDLPFESVEEAVTLASIVEKETAVASERAKVAGVFVNRLEKGMRLQSDPTVIYALTAGVPGQEGQGALGRRLLRKDLDFVSPYNTYENAGLPPGPIANPGKQSVLAVLNPAEHDYLYFVADGSGGHAFAKTLKEHNKNVAAWRKIRRQQNNSD